MRPGRGWVPQFVVRRVSEIPLDLFVRRGIEGVVFDLDNTLVPYGAWDVPEDVARWMEELRARGLRGAVVSNALPHRVRQLATAVGWPAVGGLPKPSLQRLRRAMLTLGTTPRTTALVGDQLFTDVWAGNRLGLFTVLVEPMDRREFVTTRLVRCVERLVGRPRMVRQLCGRTPQDAGGSTPTGHS